MGFSGSVLGVRSRAPWKDPGENPSIECIECMGLYWWVMYRKTRNVESNGWNNSAILLACSLLI